MGTKRYTADLPEGLAKAVEETVGPGDVGWYLTLALEHLWEGDLLKAGGQWWASEYGPATEEERAQASEQRGERDRKREEFRHVLHLARMREAVAWWDAEYGPVTEEELAEAEDARLERERRHAERDAERK